MPRPRSESRGKIIRSARTLFRRQGYHGTGLAQIIEHSGAPRGSVYFLFPKGKEQVAVEAVREWAAEITQLIETSRQASADLTQWMRRMADHFGAQLRTSGFTEGLPVTAIILETTPDSAALTQACREAYDSWLAALTQGTTEYGIDERQARSLAQLLLASLEGAMVQCRLYQSTAPLQQVTSRVLAAIVPRR